MQHIQHHHSLILLSAIILFFALGAFHAAYASDPPFSLKVEMINEYNQLIPGKDVIAMVKIFNRGAEGREDVALYYSIKDFNGKVISSESETAAVETQTSIVRRFTVPETAAKGRYILDVELSSLDKKNKAEASFSFEVIEIPKETRNLGLYLIGAITSINSIAILFRVRKASKETKVSEKDLIKSGLIKAPEFRMRGQA